jgi:hypothetical protein
MSTIWVALADPNLPQGAIPYIDTDSVPDIDVLNLFYDSVNKRMQVKNGIAFDYTRSSAAGPQTINKVAGTVKIAIAGQTVVLTNSQIDVNSLIIPFLLSDDTTSKSVVVSAQAAGSCTFKLDAAATAEVVIGFLVLPVGQVIAQ